MSNREELKTMSNSQLAVFIWTLLLSENTPVRRWKAVSDVIKFLEEEYSPEKYMIL